MKKIDGLEIVLILSFLLPVILFVGCWIEALST